MREEEERVIGDQSNAGEEAGGRERYRPLRALCLEYGFPEPVTERLCDQSGFLADWKQDVQAMTKTPKARATALARVEALAQELRLAIESLPFDLRMKLDNYYFGINSPAAEEIFDLIEIGLLESRDTDLGGSVIPRIIAAVKETAESAGLAGVASRRPGRQSTVEDQSDFIRCIATCVKPAGMTPSTSGRFRALCEAVFLAAGLTLSDRALRHFMTEIRPTVKAAGHCL